MSGIPVAHITTAALSLRYLLLNQLSYLQRAGFDVMGISAPGPEVAEVEAAGIPHFAIPLTRRMSPIADMAALGRLYRLLRRKRPTIVHTHTPKASVLGQLAARLARIPIVVNTLHGFYFHDQTPPVSRHFYVMMERLGASCSDLILSQSGEDVQTALRERICKPDRIKHLGNGIDLERFHRPRLTDDVVAVKRAELGIPDGSLVVGFVGRLVAEKGIPELMTAMESVRRHIPGVRLLVVGPVDNEKSDAIVPESANAYGISDLCIFAGLRLDMPEMYALMDIFVLPSHREGFPRSLMEASAMGVPCIATNIRGCREAVEVNRNGWLVPRGDATALCIAIIKLLNDPQKRRGFASEGQRIAKRRFDERAVFATVKTEYDRLLKINGQLGRGPGRALPQQHAHPPVIERRFGHGIGNGNSQDASSHRN